MKGISQGRMRGRRREQAAKNESMGSPGGKHSRLFLAALTLEVTGGLCQPVSNDLYTG